MIINSFVLVCNLFQPKYVSSSLLREKILIIASEDLLPILERMGLATEANLVNEEVDNVLTSTTNIKCSFTDVVSKFSREMEENQETASSSNHSQHEHFATPQESWDLTSQVRDTPPISSSAQLKTQSEPTYSLPTLTGSVPSAPPITIAPTIVQHNSYQASREDNRPSSSQLVSREELNTLMSGMLQNMQEMLNTFQIQTRNLVYHRISDSLHRFYGC